MSGSGSVRPWGVLVGCFLMSLGYNAYFIAPASTVPVFARTFGVDKPLVGVVISACLVGAILLQIPGGLVVDRYDNRRVVFWATAAFALAVVVGATTSSFAVLLASRFLAGVASVFLFTMNAKIVGDVTPERRLGVATSAYVASAPTGFALAQVASPHVVDAAGIPGVFGLFGGLAVVGYAVFSLATPAPVRSEADLSVSELSSTLRQRSLLLLSLSCACGYLLFIFLNSWMPTYAADAYGVPATTAGAVAALLPVTGLLARPSGGWLSDAIGGRRRPVIVGAFALVIPLLVAVALTDALLWFAVLLLAMGFAIQLAMGVYYVLVRELSRTGAAGTSLAVFGTIAYTGSLVSPPVGGWLIETFSWRVTFGFYVCVAVASILVVLAVPE